METSSRVPTARWVALVMLLIAILSSAALLLSWRDLEYAENTRKTLTGDIQTIRDSYDTVLASLQRQRREAEAKNRDLEGQLSVIANRLQFAQDEVELAHRKTRQLDQK